MRSNIHIKENTPGGDIHTGGTYTWRGHTHSGHVDVRGTHTVVTCTRCNAETYTRRDIHTVGTYTQWDIYTLGTDTRRGHTRGRDRHKRYSQKN